MAAISPAFALNAPATALAPSTIAIKPPTADKAAFDFQPEEIKATDTVDFLWEIES